MFRSRKRNGMAYAIPFGCFRSSAVPRTLLLRQLGLGRLQHHIVARQHALLVDRHTLSRLHTLAFQKQAAIGQDDPASRELELDALRQLELAARDLGLDAAGGVLADDDHAGPLAEAIRLDLAGAGAVLVDQQRDLVEMILLFVRPHFVGLSLWLELAGLLAIVLCLAQ